jgi:hypothetical protein
MRNPHADRQRQGQAAHDGPQDRCRSHPCSEPSAPGARYCASHLALFARVRDEIRMDFKRGRPAYLVAGDER